MSDNVLPCPFIKICWKCFTSSIRYHKLIHFMLIDDDYCTAFYALLSISMRLWRNRKDRMILPYKIQKLYLCYKVGIDINNLFFITNVVLFIFWRKAFYSKRSVLMYILTDVTFDRCYVLVTYSLGGPTGPQLVLF